MLAKDRRYSNAIFVAVRQRRHNIFVDYYGCRTTIPFFLFHCPLYSFSSLVLYSLSPSRRCHRCFLLRMHPTCYLNIHQRSRVTTHSLNKIAFDFLKKRTSNLPKRRNSCDKQDNKPSNLFFSHFIKLHRLATISYATSRN